MLAPTPPRALTEALRRYDAELRLRWGLHRELWIVERKMEPRQRQLLAERPNPWKSKRGLDLYDGWKEGYVHVLSIHPALIENVPRILEELAMADSWRQGGFEALNRRLDQLAEQEDAEAEKMVDDWTQAASYDAVDRLAWLEGRRVAVTPPAARAPGVEVRDGFVIQDRRQVARV